MSRHAPASLWIRGGRVLDPESGRDEIGDVLIRGGLIAAAGAAPPAGTPALDAAGLVVAPGLIDMHVHLRDPGETGKESIATGTAAAAHGGFTSVVCMPNTIPVADHGGIIEYIRAEAARRGLVRVFPTGSITVGLAGERMTEIGDLKASGAVALTDDGHCVQNHELMRRALQYAKHFALPVLDHCQDYSLSAGGVMHEGYWSTVLGLRGMSPLAEELIVARNVLLAEACGGDLHVQHISTRGAVELVRQARTRGVRITAEVTPHHLMFTDADVKGYDTDFKMNPPLRSKADVEALLAGLADGTITVLASDHAPHHAHQKDVEFDLAPFGVVGLETAVPAYLDRLLHAGVMSLPALVAAMTLHPARLLRLPIGRLSPGAPGDVTILDPERDVVVDTASFVSCSRNSPFQGLRLKGDAVATIVAGNVVMNRIDPRRPIVPEPCR